MRKGAKVAVVSTACAVLLGGAGYGAYNVLSAIGGDGIALAAADPDDPLDAEDVREASSAFFDAWEKGDGYAAAAATNDEAAAGALLNGLSEQASVGDVRITPQKAKGTTVPYSVRATVSLDGRSERLAYDTELTVVRGRTTGKPLVDWGPTVVHPELKEGDTLVTGPSDVPAIETVDRDGKVLTAEEYPSLGPVVDQLRERYGSSAGGSPSVELVIRHAGQNAPDTPLLTLAEGKAGTVRTTISAAAQKAAEEAVNQYPESSVVALKPSTGEVLAVANHRSDGFDAAFQGRLAPGSTMKIVTAAMLIEEGVTHEGGPAPCTEDAVWQGQTFRNVTGLVPNENATLADSFARSCNTAFIKLIDEVEDDTLTRVAQERFGLGRDDWKTGIVSFDGSVPPSGGPDRAANAIGQGQVQLSPLDVASVTATAKTGAFKQPYLVSPELDDRRLATARGLAPDVAAQLRRMMHLTATQGSGRDAMRGLGPDIGAKTGSAEVDGQELPNSWFTGYRGDVAAAAVAQQGGRGGEAAGPIVAAVLRAGG
ncbi:penicillin-binding transpeptidase domain-containing protein [Streptomyces sp. UH6]|uniref:penicillin-binding transpeptidase domain-containing protein n=1 Tax=Streptomyces sp. UH6 TaxID=2748379 RepID=UPI0015D4BB16|nr:penicillin-binding transpeptidase domain-containing protein [Streptomyces sp. UH6]NYV76787.1 penicillin-binding protein [Streptomyces sp. UH6]